MGFWRNVGYLWAVLMMIGGFILFPYGLVSVGLGLFLFFYLAWDANDEKMEKLKNDK